MGIFQLYFEKPIGFYNVRKTECKWPKTEEWYLSSQKGGDATLWGWPWDEQEPLRSLLLNRKWNLQRWIWGQKAQTGNKHLGVVSAAVLFCLFGLRPRLDAINKEGVSLEKEKNSKDWFLTGGCSVKKDQSWSSQLSQEEARTEWWSGANEGMFREEGTSLQYCALIRCSSRMKGENQPLDLSTRSLWY